MKGKIKDSFFNKIQECFICDSFPEAASGNILSGVFYKISMDISNALLFPTNGEGGD